MPGEEARSRPSLLDLSKVCLEDGPPLSLAGDLRWATQLQGFPPVPDIHDTILLRMFWGFGHVGMEGDFE